jgi:hypothetical protein
MNTITTTGSTIVRNPEAKVAVDKNLRKVKDGIVYLNDGADFQLMLFNPRTDSVLAKIYVNEEAIGSGGLIIRPGERVWLERWLDEQKKLTFTTYEVSNSDAVKEAIQNNGKIRVEFFNKSQTLWLGNNSGYTGHTFGGTPVYGSNDWNNYTNTIFYSHSDTTNIGDTSGNQTLALTGSLGNKDTKSIETGLVDKGEDSDQELKTVNESYNSFSFHTIEYSLHPTSREPKSIGEVKSYCTNCALKQRSNSWKFCPACGTKRA